MDPEDPAPTYEPVEATKPTFKKYGYNPNKATNPTIWRQQVMKVCNPFSRVITNDFSFNTESKETSSHRK